MSISEKDRLQSGLCEARLMYDRVKDHPILKRERGYWLNIILSNKAQLKDLETAETLFDESD